MNSEARERRKDGKRAGTNRKRSGMKYRRPTRNSYFHLTVRFPEDREGYEIVECHTVAPGRQRGAVVMPTAWAIKHHTVAGAFRERSVAEEYAASHPIHGGRVADGNLPGTVEYTAFYQVEPIELPALVDCANGESHGLATSKDPVKFPYCKSCFYSGQAHADMMSDRIARFEKELPGYTATVWQTGGGCMMFVVYKTGSYTDSDHEYYGLVTDEAYVEPDEDWQWIGRMHYTDEGEEFCPVYDANDHKDKRIIDDQAIARIRADISAPAPYTESW